MLLVVGSVGSFMVLAKLGRSFSIMPEARVLVTGGPYAFARHPLYAVEIITILGMAMLYKQPWAGLLAAGVIADAGGAQPFRRAGADAKPIPNMRAYKRPA